MLGVHPGGPGGVVRSQDDRAGQAEALAPAGGGDPAPDGFDAESARVLLRARLWTVGVFAAFGAAFGWLGGHESWRRVVPLLVLYGLFGLVLGWLGRREGWRGRVGVAWVMLDACVVLFIFERVLPVTRSREALAGNSLGTFLLVVVLGALTLGSPVRVAAVTLVACLGQALLQAQAQAALPDRVVAVLLIAAAGAMTGWAAARVRAFAGRAAAEEEQRRLTAQKNLELERANERIAQVNAELEVQHSRLVLAQREAEGMTSILVHDMKQPLAGMLGMIDLVADELGATPSGERARADLRLARTQGDRLLGMIDDLHAIARLERGTLAPQRQSVPLRPLLDDVAAAYRSHPRGVELAVKAPAEAAARLDRELVSRLLENLVSNALSFTRAGDRVELSAELKGPEAVISVKNSGPKVPPDLQPHLFERVVPRGGERHNAGLGLYFCRLVAEAHQGHIALEDDAEFNVSFVAHLPLA